MASLPLISYGQASGGAIKRPVKKPTQTTSAPAKPAKPSSSGNSKSSTSSSNRGTILAQLEHDMVFVEGGTFTMGATSEQGSDAYKDEKPTHQVTLSSFYISEHEVTQAEYQAVMGSNPSNFKGANRPVEQVSWNDCQTFISKLNSITGKNFRLPTEAEWEYAARGGNMSKGHKYSGSNYLNIMAWYDYNSKGETHDVKTSLPNELGLYDMSGNVWEWCEDWIGNYSSSSQTNPKGPSLGSRHVTRGGSCYGNDKSCRVSHRSSFPPSENFKDVGLRLAL